jgi:hypothetical protein
MVMGRLRVLLAAVAASAAMTTGCSGENGPKQDAAPGAPTTVAAPTGTAPTEFCATARTFEQRFRDLVASDRPEVAESFFVAAREALTSLSSSAPNELKADIAVMAGAYERLLTGLRQVQFDYPKLPPEILRDLNGPPVSTASERLGAYLRTTCGVS